MSRGRLLLGGWSTTALADAAKIIGKPSSEIESLLGYMGEEELVHRDNLVLA